MKILIPPASPLNAEFLIDIFKTELKILHKAIKNSKFDKRAELKERADELSEKVEYYENYYPPFKVNYVYQAEPTPPLVKIIEESEETEEQSDDHNNFDYE
jgi:hypothetical protein